MTMLTLLTLLMTACSPCSHQTPVDTADSAAPASPDWVELVCAVSGMSCVCDASGYGALPLPINAWVHVDRGTDGRPDGVPDEWAAPYRTGFDSTNRIYTLESDGIVHDCRAWIYAG